MAHGLVGHTVQGHASGDRPGAFAWGWRKAGYSERSSGCIEVGAVGAERAVRDTQNRELGGLAFDRTEWTAWLASVIR
ncbi:DUF397 domain-containing protein [Nocardiopsis synnemataformans]|uniref:DUF397 domain-containing protein n=1 Tax=Nocardiopsis synnemataformans TaxID=61305 RepID=UPI003EB6B652